MIVDFGFSSALTNYRLLSNTITPRPIAWVSSINSNGVVNLAPFSFFGVVNSTPPIFSLCFSLKSDGTPKDTLQNLRDTKRVSISLVMVDWLEKVEQSASEIEPNRSEASVFDIELESIECAYPPLPKGVKVAYFCDLREILNLSVANTTALIEAKKCFVDDEIYKDDLCFLPPHLGRVGKYYLQAKEVIDPKIKE